MEHKNGDRLPLQFMARREEWDTGISLYLRQVTVGQGSSLAQPLEFKTVELGYYSEPFLKIGIQTAQQLMDELWQCGLRPTEGTGSAGSLKATENHLDDMRKIVFSKLNIK